MRTLLFTAALACYAATPVPKATLIPVTADSYPFGAADHARVPEELSKIGYVEEEFLSPARPMFTTGRKPDPPWSAPRMRHTPREF
jgi:hypothetical protein